MASRLQSGISCLDCGCGGGDVTFDLASRIGPHGRVVGVDIDEVKLDDARREAVFRGLAHVEFRRASVEECAFDAAFDLIYSRFLLTHLPDPQAALGKLHRSLAPGGTLIVEDVDFEGHFSHPECDAFRQYVRLYCDVAVRRGADPRIGRRLPALLREAGFDGVEMHVVQPAGFVGDVKLIGPMTMESIVDPVVTEGLAERRELDRIIAELYAFARNPRTVLSLPRIVQVWGRKSG